MENVTISIYCQTYNHAPYIRDAIEGFLAQKTEYSYHIFIYDDASNDGTSDIIKEYKNNYPDKITLYRPAQNSYKEEIQNGFRGREQLKKKYLTGKYIALCEGDDYWIDPHKLQTQIDYMEIHPECIMTVHDAWRIDCQTGEKKKHSNFETDGYLSIEDIIIKGAGGLPTASFVVRKDAFFWDDKFPRCGVGDWPQQLFSITKGKIYYFDKKMAVYRYMHLGAWSEKYTNNKLYAICHRLEMIDFLIKYDKYTDKKFHLSVRERENTLFEDNLQEYTEIDDMELDEKECLKLSFETDGKYDIIIAKMRKVWGLLQGILGIDSEILTYSSKFKYIVVMGMGKYSNILTQVLNKLGIQIDGHILSNNQQIPEIENKKIWKIKDYPYNWEETGVFVGLHSKWQNEAEMSLIEEVSSYYAPFWIEDNKFSKLESIF